MASAVAHGSARIEQAQGLLAGAQDFNVFVQTHPTAPQHRQSRLPIARAPEMSAEAPDHAHRFPQWWGLARREGFLEANVQRFDLLGREHLVCSAPAVGRARGK